MPAGSGSSSVLRDDELTNVDLAEADAFSALFETAKPQLGTGSADVIGSRAIWHPQESEAGYSYLMNLHLASDLDLAYERGLDLMRVAGSSIYGVPVDKRVAAWATPERLASLGLHDESEEVIWTRRIASADADLALEPPEGVEIQIDGIDEIALRDVITEGWGLPRGHSRGVLYGGALRTKGWAVRVPRIDGRTAGVSMFCSYRRVGMLMLAVVLPEYRGRGLQSYFIRERIAESARRGCTIAISETNDDNASPRNLERAGFVRSIQRRVYARAL